MSKKSPRQLQREIDAALATPLVLHGDRWVSQKEAAARAAFDPKLYERAVAEGRVPPAVATRIAKAAKRSGQKASHATRSPRQRQRGVHRTHHAVRKSTSDKINIDQLAGMLDLPPYDDIDEYNHNYVWESGDSAYKSALEDDETEDKAEAAREKAEQAAQSEIYGKWYDAAERAASSLFKQHHLELSPTGKQGTKDRRYDFKIVPEKSWLDSAEKIRQTAEGVGAAYVGNDVKEFLRLGPWSARQAVLEHIGVIASYPEVYGSSSARRIYDNAFG